MNHARITGRNLEKFLDTKTKVPKMIVEDTDKTERDEREFIEIVVRVLRIVDGQVCFPIHNGMCGRCTFQRRCAGWTARAVSPLRFKPLA